VDEGKRPSPPEPPPPDGPDGDNGLDDAAEEASERLRRRAQSSLGIGASRTRSSLRSVRA